MGIQDGIYFRSGQAPGRCYSVMFLRAEPESKAGSVDAALTGLWDMYAALREGHIGDLPGVDLPAGNLSVLIAYGLKAFAIKDARRTLPADLGPRHQFKSPQPSGGGQLLAGSALAYADGLARNPATEEIAIQAIADTPLVANRAIVETVKYLEDHPDPQTGRPALALAAAFTGFNREDGRSWIDFHDGVSNLAGEQQRLAAMVIKKDGKPAADLWTAGGTYMVFLRLGVDLRSWRKLSQVQQELLVGRTKISGCAIKETAQDGGPVAVAGCPVMATRTVMAPGNEALREPPTNPSAELAISHVQRANHHIGPPDREVSRRVFRQGYEFLDPPQPGRELSLGLNFVSFQDTPARVMFMLTTPGWLGDVNFGGDPGQPLPGIQSLLSVAAGAVFLCPPAVEGEKYPGRSIFAKMS